MPAPPDTPDILSALTAAVAANQPVVLATVVQARGSVPRHAGAKILVYADGKTLGTVGGGELEARVLAAAGDCIASGRPQFLSYSLVDPARGDPGVCGGSVDVYLEPYGTPATLLIIGAGHVGRALAHLARWLGYRVVVTDDRVELVTPDLVPDADVYLPGAIDEILIDFEVTPRTVIAVLTRNVLVDREVLPRLLATPAPYIGVIGSRRRWAETRRLLLEDGLSETDLARFHSPIGLNLNAETPEEIAVSIMAEVLMFRRGGTGERMAGAQETAAADSKK